MRGCRPIEGLHRLVNRELLAGRPLGGGEHLTDGVADRQALERDQGEGKSLLVIHVEGDNKQDGWGPGRVRDGGSSRFTELLPRR